MKQHSLIRNIISMYFPSMNESFKVKLLLFLDDIQEENVLDMFISLFHEIAKYKEEEKKQVIKDLNDKLNQQGIKLKIK